MSKNPFQNFVVRYAASERIFSESEEGATMYVVQSGRVRLFREIEGQERPIAVMEKGDFFGEMSILEGMPRTLSAAALEDSELIEINSSTFDKMIRGNIEIAIRMLRKLSIRLRETERRIAELQPAGSRAPGIGGTAFTAIERPAAAGGTGVRLEVQDGLAFDVQRDETLIGRYDPVTELRPDIDLTDVDLKRSVSRRHARLVRQSEGYTLVEEVGALNGTFVNGNKLVPGQPFELADGDQVNLGTVSLRFRLSAP